MNAGSSIVGMNFALVSVLIPAIVALVVSMISPVLTHFIWKRQKRKEQQLAVAERFAVLRAAVAAATSFDLPVSKTSFKTSPAEMELLGVLFVIPVLFQKDETVSRAKDLLSGNPKVHVSVQRVELQAYLFAEALNIPFKKIMNLAE